MKAPLFIRSIGLDVGMTRVSEGYLSPHSDAAQEETGECLDSSGALNMAMMQGALERLESRGTLTMPTMEGGVESKRLSYNTGHGDFCFSRLTQDLREKPWWAHQN